MTGIYTLKLTSAIAVDGEVMKAGSIVEVSEIEAKNLLSRGKAELHGEQAAAPRDLNALTKAELLELAEQLQITVNCGNDDQVCLCNILQGNIGIHGKKSTAYRSFL